MRLAAGVLPDGRGKSGLSFDAATAASGLAEYSKPVEPGSGISYGGPLCLVGGMSCPGLPGAGSMRDKMKQAGVVLPACSIPKHLAERPNRASFAPDGASC